MGFCQCSDSLVTELSVLEVAEIKLSVLIIQAMQFPIAKNGVYKAFDNKRYQWYEFDDSPLPSFWTKAVSIKRKTSKIRLCTKKSTLLVKKSR